MRARLARRRALDWHRAQDCMSGMLDKPANVARVFHEPANVARVFDELANVARVFDEPANLAGALSRRT